MRKLVIPVCAAAAVAAAVMMAQSNKGKPAENHDLGYSDTPVLPGQKWKVHDVERPRPRIITPGRAAGEPVTGEPRNGWVIVAVGLVRSFWKTAEPENGGFRLRIEKLLVC